jgi:hypothetical protein
MAGNGEGHSGAARWSDGSPAAGHGFEMTNWTDETVLPLKCGVRAEEDFRWEVPPTIG